jgi:hypothetical protein
VIGMEIMLRIYILDILYSNLGQGPGCTTGFLMVFLSPSRRVPGYYLDYVMIASFQFLSNSSFTYNSTLSSQR